MKKINVISIGVVFAIVVVISILIAQNSKQNTTEGTVQESGDNSESSFADFVAQGEGSYECQVSQYIDAGMQQSADGIVFIHNGMIRGDYAVEAAGVSLSTSLVVKDDFVYTWTSMAPFGVKAPVDHSASSDAETPMSGTYAWDADMIGSYDCVDWTPNLSKFEIPTNITFQEM